MEKFCGFHYMSFFIFNIVIFLSFLTSSSFRCCNYTATKKTHVRSDNYFVELTKKQLIFRYVKLYYKIVKHNFLIYTFATKEWTFYNDNLKSVWNKMNNKDKKIFSYDFQKINFDEFIQTMHLGFKKYIMKDNMDAESISKCRRKYIRSCIGLLVIYILLFFFFCFRLTFLHNTLLIIFFITCIYFLWKFLNCIS